MIEFAVGITILFVRPSVGALVASLWLPLVAGNLVLGGHYDIGVRDVVLAVASYAPAELAAAGETGETVTGTNDASVRAEVHHHALRASRL